LAEPDGDGAVAASAASERARPDRAAPPTARSDQEAGADRPPASARSAGAATPAVSAAGAGVADASVAGAAAIPERRSGRRTASWEGTPLPTGAGGLLFLIHPLAR